MHAYIHTYHNILADYFPAIKLRLVHSGLRKLQLSFENKLSHAVVSECCQIQQR